MGYWEVQNIFFMDIICKISDGAFQIFNLNSKETNKKNHKTT